jgi:NCAIR mutase (PurE)-related proteins
MSVSGTEYCPITDGSPEQACRRRSSVAALNSMLVSCVQGVMVTNIDNGFGAACAAAGIIHLPGPLPLKQ